MALVTCPECKKEISDTAKECIHCGYSIINQDKQKKEWGGINGFFSTLFILSLGTVSIFIAPSKGDTDTIVGFGFMTLIIIVTLLVILTQKDTDFIIKIINWIIWSIFAILLIDTILVVSFNNMIVSNMIQSLYQ